MDRTPPWPCPRGPWKNSNRHHNRLRQEMRVVPSRSGCNPRPIKKAIARLQQWKRAGCELVSNFPPKSSICPIADRVSTRTDSAPIPSEISALHCPSTRRVHEPTSAGWPRKSRSRPRIADNTRVAPSPPQAFPSSAIADPNSQRSARIAGIE